MERPYRIIFPEPRWPWLHTALRILFTGLLIWAFSVGSSPLSFGIGALLGVVDALALLLAYELAIRDLSSGWISAGIYTLIGASLIGYGAWLATRPPPPTGPLLPAREATPDASCAEKVGPKTLVMAFSTDRTVGTGPGPFYPFNVDECSVMALRRVGKGLMVNAYFYDFNGDVAFTINDNVYAPTMPLQLRQFRPDPHSIVVLDRFDQEVLYVRYLNPNAVRIRGRFLCGTAPQAVIHDDAILVGGVRISGAYFGQRPARGHVCATIKAGVQGIAISGR
jgi:hypothetical protein